MKRSPSHCILCVIPGIPDVWNSLKVLKCPGCGLVWRTDFDLPSDFYKTVEVDVEAGKKESRRKNTQNQIKTLRKFLPLSGICDLGAGDGTFLSELRDAGFTDCVGVEPGENGLRISKERNLEVFQGTISDLPQISQRKKIHAVTMFHLLEHLDDPKGSLETIRKNLDSRGVLVLETPDADAPIQHITKHKNHLVYPEHLFYWTETALQKLLFQTGFSVVSVKRRSFNWQEAPIRRSLLRLGFALVTAIPTKMQQESQEHAAKQQEDVQAQVSVLPQKTHQKDLGGFLRSAIRTFLAYLVHGLRRDDYLLVIAQPRQK